MRFSSMLRDTVDVRKKDGRVVTGVRANVQRTQVFMMADGLVIEAGDQLIRHMSTGAEETLEVVDPGFQERLHGIPAHYQMLVRREGIPSDAAQSVTYNVSGANARISQNSVDASVNVVVGDTRLMELLADLESEIERLDLSDGERASALEIMAAARGQVESGTRSKAVLNALLSSLPTAARVTSIVTSILALLR